MDHEEIEHAAEPNLQFLRQKSKIRWIWGFACVLDL